MGQGTETPEEGAWPAVTAPEIPVTPEMMAAGQVAFGQTPLVCTLGSVEDAVSFVYRAMAALAPVELVSEGEIQAVRQRDEALAGSEYWATSWRRERSERVAFRSELTASQAHIERLLDANCALVSTNERLRDEIDALTVEKASLHDMVTQFTTANVPDPSNESEHNPFRLRERDRRRMGPEGI